MPSAVSQLGWLPGQDQQLAVGEPLVAIPDTKKFCGSLDLLQHERKMIYRGSRFRAGALGFAFAGRVKAPAPTWAADTGTVLLRDYLLDSTNATVLG